MENRAARAGVSRAAQEDFRQVLRRAGASRGMTGIGTPSAMVRVSSQSKPA